MASSGQSVLCVYRYDGLDRLADCAPAGQGDTRLFYQKSRLATQIQGQIQYTLLRTDEYLLAQRRMENNQSDCALLATDQQQSVIAAQGLAFAYTPYGDHHPAAGPMNLPGFTGQRVDPVTGHYLLGNGYRAFNPVLMRFNSPDSLSPFGEGGVNAYGYCGGDPVNRMDANGHVPSLLRPLLKVMRFFKPKPIKNLKVISKDIVSFEDTANGAKRINFFGHGYRLKEHGYHPMRTAGRSFTPDQLYHSAVTSGVKFDKYKKIRLIMCHSGSGESKSFAAVFSDITQKPVKGYVSGVFARPEPEKIISMIVNKSDSIRWLGSGKNRYDKGLSILKKNIFAPDSFEYTDFSYEPVVHQFTEL
ncbi:RHS repeat-associated core domain-containing protein [Pseudomonas congelans]|uniref:RHS repeat-associated core domain-containing protein n=1 Tax=Pseudomonas congelans TaxID=200452 RepID=UPI001EFD41EC|nr:RHS repeat-associated core domain-containing protein [Pseudomonas congelans]